MAPKTAPELSIEQLIRALSKKLSAECTQLQEEMPPRSRALVTTLASEIDALEKRAKDVLHEVVSLRNSLRPVNRLPPGVLASCATFVSDNDPRPIVTLTHVCRYWYKAIGSNPSNWASIATGWKRLAPLCLERAGVLPLAVDITISDIKDDSTFLEQLIPHTSRIGSLRIIGHSSVEAIAGELPGFFDSPMPDLTSLELEQTEESANQFPPKEAVVPPVFRNLSKLRSLRLTRTPLYSPLYNIAPLTELKLTSYGYNHPIQFEPFVGFLDSNKSLETATLDVQFVGVVLRGFSLRMVTLPRLRHLSITYAKPTDARGLFTRMVGFPPGIHLEVLYTGLDLPDLLQSSLPLNPLYIHGALTPITTLKVQNSPRELHILGSGGSFTFRTLRFTTRLPELHLFPTTSVREFHVNNEPWSLARVFLDCLLKQMPTLETLVFTRTQSWTVGAFDSLAGHPSLCPSLKTIAFFNCAVTPQVMRELEGVLARRKSSTATWIHRVVIINSTGVFPDYSLVLQLKQQVPYIDMRVADTIPDFS